MIDGKKADNRDVYFCVIMRACICVCVPPGHAREVPPEVAGAVGSGDFLGIDHHRVTLQGERRVTLVENLMQDPFQARDFILMKSN